MKQQSQSLPVKIDPSVIEVLDTTAQALTLESIDEIVGSFSKSLTLAGHLKRFRQALTPDVVGVLMELQGTALGFRTDKDPQGYAADVVRDCAIEASMYGARMVGGEVTIIAGKAYLSKPYFERRLAELPGLTDLKVNFGVPRGANGGAVVPSRADWVFNGKADSIDAEIPVRMNSSMGADAALGKATRKLLARVLQRVTGSKQSFPEGDADDAGRMKNVTPVHQERITSLGEAVAAPVAPVADEQAQKEADFAAEEAARVAREPGED